jgi:hypothetical protein
VVDGKNVVCDGWRENWWCEKVASEAEKLSVKSVLHTLEKHTEQRRTFRICLTSLSFTHQSLLKPENQASMDAFGADAGVIPATKPLPSAYYVMR